MCAHYRVEKFTHVIIAQTIFSRIKSRAVCKIAQQRAQWNTQSNVKS